ncbi:hypothetical protein QYF61_026255 [Mycteria americana]|uniref:Uncharacterized protein n=1 Tax=Mycteria americana TaxID=33587 RepID=A0AAN7N9F1_MYCAM|nr:hypothetical protein QYF61_026255 [Mycteria americana]
MLKHLNVPLVVRGPKLNTVFKGHDHFPSPAGHAISDTSQDAIGFLGHLGTLPAHVQLAVNQHSQVLLCWAAFQPLFPKPEALHGVVVAQVQDLALSLVESHTIGLNPSIQPVQVPLQSLPSLQQINTPTQLGVVCKLTEGALDPFIQIIDKDVKQDWPQHRALGDTTCDRPPTGVNSIRHDSLGLAVQPVLYPAKSTPVQAMSSQFLQENTLRCPSLDTLQHLNIPLVVRGPKLNTVFKVQPHQCRVQGHDHFPSPAGHTIFDTSQDAIGLLGHLGTLPAHVQPAVNQHSQVLLCWAAFQPLFPKPIALHGVVVAQVQDPALCLVKPHTIDLGPSIQPVQIPLKSLPTLRQVDTAAQLGVFCKLTEGACNPLIQIIDKDIKQDWPQN